MVGHAMRAEFAMRKRERRSRRPPKGWPAAIRRVLADPEQAQPVFQPIADLSRGTAVGYEALIRFPDAAVGPPDRWLAAAAAEGLASRLEALLIRTALDGRRSLPPGCFLSINVGPAALLSPEVRAVLLGTPSLTGVVIEITEDALEDYDRLVPAVSELREAGARLAVDDIGSGYSSLARIVALRPDFVKIAHELVVMLHRNDARTAAVQTLVTLASRLDASVIAEGIEGLEELGALMGMRVPLGQGFALGYPLPTMDGLLPTASNYIRDHANHSTEGSVEPLIEPVPTVPRDAEPEAAERLLRADPRLRFVALLDESGRAAALVERGESETALLPVTMRVKPSSSVRTAARKALGRSRVQRYQPLVCCDDQGRLVGLVPFERLVRALAKGAPPGVAVAPRRVADGELRTFAR